MKKIQENGQTLVFVLLVMTVSLAVGIAASTRTISTVRRTTDVDTSSRALAAAEAAVEYYLSRPISELEAMFSGNSCSETVTRRYPLNSSESLSSDSNITTFATVTFQRYGCIENQNDSYVFSLEKDDVLELKLGTSSSSKRIEICWNYPTGGGATSSSLFIMEVSGASPNYNVRKVGYNYSSGAYSNTFRTSSVLGGNPSGFDRCAGSSYTTASNPRLLRIVSLYNSSTIRIENRLNGARIPYQGYSFTSVGQVGESQGVVKRTVFVTRSLPYLPTPFNFAVFNNLNNLGKIN